MVDTWIHRPTSITGGYHLPICSYIFKIYVPQIETKNHPIGIQDVRMSDVFIGIFYYI